MTNCYLRPIWPTPNNILAFTTLRFDGFSQAPYASFNLADRVGDNITHVAANRKKLCQELELPQEPLWLRQTHSNKIVCADKVTPYTEADASYTTKKNIVCAVLTADCLPILLCDKQGSIVAAIHAGWKGLVHGIIENTIEALKIDNNNLLVWFGPAISVEAFEVGIEVYDNFSKYNPLMQKAFTKTKPDKWMADIYRIARQILITCGIMEANIYGGDYCTYCNEQYFFSYRRDGQQTGRMANLIYLT
jgi:polyphenol oxidase